MSDKKNKALERRVVSYPSPKVFNLVDKYSEVNEMTRSETVALALRQFFDQMPAEQRNRILSRNAY